jgi:hypothetical protein
MALLGKAFKKRKVDQGKMPNCPISLRKFGGGKKDVIIIPARAQVRFPSTVTGYASNGRQRRPDRAVVSLADDGISESSRITVERSKATVTLAPVKTGGAQVRRRTNFRPSHNFPGVGNAKD